MKIESLLQFLDDYLEVADHPDYSNALNGLQLEGPREVERVVAAVDASEAAIEAAVEAGGDLLLVHHGLFWDGLGPLRGRRFRRVARAIEGGLAIYSAHLPLDSHPEVGNCAVLARELGVPLEGRFGAYEGTELGWWGTVDASRAELARRVESVVGRDVHVLAGGGEEAGRVAVLTGGGGSFIRDAAREGIDTLVTGEGGHHTYFDAMELGVNVLYAGHYATEIWGVRALAAELEDRFGLPWTFLDQPTGL